MYDRVGFTPRSSCCIVGLVITVSRSQYPDLDAGFRVPRSVMCAFWGLAGIPFLLPVTYSLHTKPPSFP